MEPFDITVGSIHYAVFPEGNETYTIFKGGTEYVQLQKDTSNIWLKLDYQTEMPIFEENEEFNQIGQQIEAYKALPQNEEDEEEAL